MGKQSQEFPKNLGTIVNNYFLPKLLVTYGKQPPIIMSYLNHHFNFRHQSHLKFIRGSFGLISFAWVWLTLAKRGTLSYKWTFLCVLITIMLDSIFHFNFKFSFPFLGIHYYSMDCAQCSKLMCQHSKWKEECWEITKYLRGICRISQEVHSIVKLNTMCDKNKSTFYIKHHQNESKFYHFFSWVDI